MTTHQTAPSALGRCSLASMESMILDPAGHRLLAIQGHDLVAIDVSDPTTLAPRVLLFVALHGVDRHEVLAFDVR